MPKSKCTIPILASNLFLVLYHILIIALITLTLLIPLPWSYNFFLLVEVMWDIFYVDFLLIPIAL